MLCRGVIIQSGRYKPTKSTSDIEVISYLFTYVKGRTIRNVMEGGGGGFSSNMNFFSLMFPLNEYFFVKMLCTNIFFP